MFWAFLVGRGGGFLFVWVFLFVVVFLGARGDGGQHMRLKILLSAALPQAEWNTSVPCHMQKAKAISGTQIWGPLQAILGIVVN